jgi:phosphohistidine phosphatase SixA
MKKIAIGTLLFLAIASATCSCSTVNYYVVRHAEKVNNTDDPPLNPDGFQRAEALADTLRLKNIQVIFVSEKQRTQQTAAPTADTFSLMPIVFLKQNTAGLIDSLKTFRKKNILVVWHSENIHTIINELAPSTPPVLPIGDAYNNLFHIKKQVVLSNKTIRVTRTIY